MRIKIKGNEIKTANKVYLPRRIYDVIPSKAQVWIKMGWAVPAPKVSDVSESSQS